MAIQFDPAGSISIPAVSLSGAFSVSGVCTFPSDLPSHQYLVYQSNSHFVAILSTGSFRAKVAGTFVEVEGSITFTAGELFTWVLTRDASDNVTLTVKGVAGDAVNAPGNFLFNVLGKDCNATLNQLFTVSGDGINARSYDTDEYAVNTDTDFIDTLDSQNGALIGYTAGTSGFIPDAAGSILITSIADYQCLDWDENESALFTVAGTYSGSPVNIMYTINGGLTSQLLVTSPSGGTFTGDVLVNGQVDIEVFFSNARDKNDTVHYITAAPAFVRPAQSNTSMRGENLQEVRVGLNKFLPIMWKDGIFQPLTDPVNGYDNNSAGSCDPLIASLMVNAGIPVCIGNVAQGGQGYNDWQKGGTYYPRIQAFADAVGGTISIAQGVGGENDASNSQSVIEADVNAFINDIKADFGCDYLLVKYPTINFDAAALSAFNAVLASNPNALDGGDLSVLDISIGANASNDGIHIVIDDDIDQAAHIQFDARMATLTGTVVTSRLIVTVTDMANDTELVEFFDLDTNAYIDSRNVTFASDVLNETLDVAVGTRIGAILVGSNPPTTGTGIYGVTINA